MGEIEIPSKSSRRIPVGSSTMQNGVMSLNGTWGGRYDKRGVINSSLVLLEPKIYISTRSARLSLSLWGG